MRTEEERSASRGEWLAHLVLVGLGVVLILPVGVVDGIIDLDGDSPGNGLGFTMDFGGSLLIAYVVAWALHNLIATAYVYVGRGRNVPVALVAHVAAFATLMTLGCVVFEIIQYWINYVP